MKIGTSLRFLFPTSPATHEAFKRMLAAAPPGSFIERPLGDYDTATQARNLLEVAEAAREAGLSGLLVGDNHGMAPAYANCFQPVPTIARLMAETGDLPVGMVLLAPFYHPVLLAEQIGTLAAFARGPLIVTLALGGNARAFDAFGIPMRQRAGRLEELLGLLRALLAGERVTHSGRHFQLEGVQISPLPPVPVELWVAGTVPASAERAGRLGDAWLTGQNASREDLIEQLAIYREACARAGRTPRPVLRRDIHVGESDMDATAQIDPILAEGYRGGGAERLLLGGSETVARQLEEYRSLGFDEVMVRHVTGDHAQMLASIARIGRDVLPHVRDR